MPTQLTKVDVWNLALDHISERPLATPLDDNVYARFLQRQYPNTLDAELRANPWNFSIEYHSLAKDPTNPDYRWSYRYRLPQNWLRILPASYQGYRSAPPVEHEIAGDYMLSDGATPMKVRVIERKENPGEWDPLFVEVIAARLAVKMAYRFTAKAGYLDAAKDAYQSALAQAQMADSLEGTPEPVEQSSVINVRYR